MIQREVGVSLNDAEFSIYTGSCLHYVDCLLAGWQLLHITSMTINSLLHLTSWCCSAIFLQQYGSLFSSYTSTNSIAARWNHCVFFLLWSVLFGDQLLIFLDHQLFVFPNKNKDFSPAGVATGAYIRGKVIIHDVPTITPTKPAWYQIEMRYTPIREGDKKS